MRDSQGRLVDSNQRPETLADYYQNVQWRHFLPTVLPDGEQLGDVLPMDLEPFSDTELRAVLRKLKLGKASGEDGILPEHLKALLFNEEARLELLSLINSCWRAKDIPSEWRCSQVVAIFKKGDQSDPGN